jgi:hypothetical protein
VKYVDYVKTPIPISNGLYQYTHKRLSFQHESEVRALIWRHDAVNRPLVSEDAVTVSIDVDPDQLFAGVHVSPTAPPWFGELVESVTRHYGISASVERSSLYDRPSY